MLNLKPVAITVLELLAFNTQKFRGSRDPGHANFRDCSPEHVSGAENRAERAEYGVSGAERRAG